MTKKITLSILLLVSLFTILPIASEQAVAQEETTNSALDRFQRVGEGLGKEEEEPQLVNQIGLIINFFISILGVLFMMQAIWAGYTWMTAHGNEEKLGQAKRALRSSIIGFIITMSAYALSITVVSRISSIASQQVSESE